MKNYRVTVNGKSYDVVVEELSASQGPVPAPSPVAPPVAAVPPVAVAPVAPVPSSPAVQGDLFELKSPMPGTILDIKVTVGSDVSQNQVVLILEAMKMENEVVAPVAGKIAAVHIAKGASVNSGDLLISISQ